MVYITGDTHGEMSRFSNHFWSEGRSLGPEDVVIIAGDCGLISNNVRTPEEQYWIDWLDNKPWTTLYVDGNHENHPLLNALSTDTLFGGKVGVVSKKIYHLKRGEVYNIAGKKVFTFGGADSIDKIYRKAGISWWPEELPSGSDIENALDNLEQHNNSIDTIIAHTAPESIVNSVFAKYGPFDEHPDPTRRFLEHVIQNCQYQNFYCGHWHEDVDFGKFHFLYYRIVEMQ